MSIFVDDFDRFPYPYHDLCCFSIVGHQEKTSHRFERYTTTKEIHINKENTIKSNAGKH